MHGFGSGPFHPFMMLVFGAILVVPAWRICTRVGYSGWWSLAVLFPIANVVLLYLLAFTEWPVERRRSGDAGPA